MVKNNADTVDKDKEISTNCSELTSLFCPTFEKTEVKFLAFYTVIDLYMFFCLPVCLISVWFYLLSWKVGLYRMPDIFSRKFYFIITDSNRGLTVCQLPFLILKDKDTNFKSSWFLGVEIILLSKNILFNLPIFRSFLVSS